MGQKKIGGQMNNVSNIMLGLIASLLICILVTLAQFTRSPVVVVTATEQNDLVEIQKIQIDLNRLKARIGAQ